MKAYVSRLFGKRAYDANAIFLTLALGACAVEPPAEERDDVELGETGSTAESREAAFSAYLTRHVVPDHEQGYVVEGDLGFSSLDQVRDYYEQNLVESNALTVERYVAFGVTVDSKSTTPLTLTYCISNAAPPAGFASFDHGRVRDAVAAASAAWEDSARVRFVYVPSENGACTSANSNVFFNVRPYCNYGTAEVCDTVDNNCNGVIDEGCSTGGAASSFPNASAFYPHESRNQRELRVNLAKIDRIIALGSPKTLTGIMRHELGHALGFRHEHINVPQTDQSCIEGDSSFRQVTSYDDVSVMHYLQCPNRMANLDYTLSQRDIEGVMAQYYDDLVAVGKSGVLVYNAPNGLYRRSLSTNWQRFEDGVRQMLVIGSDLYTLSRDGQTVRVLRNFAGPIGSWLHIGNTAAQIFDCAGRLCGIYPPTGDVYEYSTPAYDPNVPNAIGTWTMIGGPGRKFVTANNELYGQDPTSENIYVRRGGVWQWFAGAMEDVVGGGPRLLAVSADTGSTRVFNTSTGTSSFISSRRAQVVQSGGRVFAMALDRSSVLMWSGSGTSWQTVGGPAKHLLPSEDPDTVYAVGMDEGIYVFSLATGIWTPFGPP